MIDGGGGLFALACPIASQCTAVDGSGNEVTFDPATGAVNPAGVTTVDTGHFLQGVSCPLATQCTAVDNAGRQVTFNPVDRVGELSRSHDSRFHALVACGLVPERNAMHCDGRHQNGREVTFDPTTGRPTQRA